MATIEAIGNALGAAAVTLDAVRSQQEWATAPNVSANSLVVVVEYDGSAYDAAFQGASHNLRYKLHALGAQDSERAAREMLLALCDPTTGSTTALRSVINGTLGGLVVDCRISANTGLKDYPLAGPNNPGFPGIEFTVVVMPS